MGQEGSSSSNQDTGHSHFNTLSPATDRYSPTASTVLLSTHSPENAATTGSISAKQNISTSVPELTGSEAGSSNNGWRNPLHIAARSGHNQVVEILLRSGKVSCDEEDSDDLTALMHAVIAGHTEAVQSLLLHGASITGGNGASDKRRPSALHWAIQYRREDILRLLLTHCSGNKSLIDCFDNVGRTSLHLASELDYVAGVVVLLEFGADPRLNTLTLDRYAS
ncbi:ankyrin repeat-containing domain protein [Xylaria flabelliformis]|nr:ankyrin repeat-containing domain protein [Xylaria flabelliformis]